MAFKLADNRNRTFIGLSDKERKERLNKTSSWKDNKRSGK